MPELQPAGFAQHDHGHCVASALLAAETACKARGVQFTAVRRRVLEILAEAHAALGAYDVLARLSAEGLGSQPPVAYRALSFLVEQGFAHRIERFSHRATLGEISENDFNLNIPRYVDTFEADAEIDLAAVAAEVRAIEGNMAALDKSIRDFCAELGLEAPV